MLLKKKREEGKKKKKAKNHVRKKQSVSLVGYKKFSCVPFSSIKSNLLLLLLLPLNEEGG